MLYSCSHMAVVGVTELTLRQPMLWEARFRLA